MKVVPVGEKMEQRADFLFHGNLVDFLTQKQRHQWISHPYKGNPVVKDVIEALGIPHPEVGCIQMDALEVDFKEKLKPFSRVDVYPAVPELLNQPLPPLQIPYQRPARFILDVHLGKLSSYLRMFGFDTLYEPTYTDQAIAERAANENRIILTRDVGLLKQKIVQKGYWLRSQLPEEQLKEVFTRYGLFTQTAPFSRCISCNGALVQVTKSSIQHLLPPKTRQYFFQFYQCNSCLKVYWQGSHYERMLQKVNDFKSGFGKE